jgi:DNA-binding NarL/FixJ family response regulator
MIRILLADDQSLIRRGLKVLLESAEQTFVIVGEAENGTEAIQLVQQEQPDIVLMDIQMPQVDGVAATRTICQRFPQVRVLVLSTFPNPPYVSAALEAGAAGYLLKSTPFEELSQAIQFVMKGYTQIGPGLNPVLAPSLHRNQLPESWTALTMRERKIIHLILKGYSNWEIAQDLCLSEKTVKNNITQLLTRLNLRDRTQLAITALRGGFQG